MLACMPASPLAFTSARLGPACSASDGAAVDLHAHGAVLVLALREEGLQRGHGVEGDPVRDGGQGHVDIQAVGPRLVEDHRLPLALQLLERLRAVEHALEAVVHPVAAAPLRLVLVRAHPRQVRRDALAVGAAGAQGDSVPTAGQLLVDEVPDLRDEFVVGVRVVLQHQGDGLAALCAGGAGQCTEVAGSAAHGAHDAAHAVLGPLGLRLSSLDVVGLGEGALAVRLLAVLLVAHVEAVHALAGDVELAQAPGDVLPALLLRGQVQHIDADVRPEPLGGPGQLRLRPVLRLAGPPPVAEVRVLQRLEGRGGPGGHATQLGDRVPCLSPGEGVAEVRDAAVALHHHPAPVPAEGARAEGLVGEHPVADILARIEQLPLARELHLRLRSLLVADLWRHGNACAGRCCFRGLCGAGLRCGGGRLHGLLCGVSRSGLHGRGPVSRVLRGGLCNRGLLKSVWGRGPRGHVGRLCRMAPGLCLRHRRLARWSLLRLWL
mmetsp:Transcript_38414/g.122081  ORF Transcript_38414/g.122081 Transcript_38414/m.122081 type:complete len:492 (-) Transcript_38414:603-2078(-)